MIASCFVLDAVVLLIYARTGTASVLVAASYALTGLSLVADLRAALGARFS